MSGRQNNAPTPKDVHDLIPRTCKYIRLHDTGGIKAADGIQVVNQLTLK